MTAVKKSGEGSLSHTHILLVLALFITLGSPIPALAASVIGNIGSVSHDNGYVYVKGWSCQTGLNRSIEVQLKVRNSNNNLQNVAKTLADKDSSGNSNIAKNCGNNTAHSFTFKVRKQQMLGHRLKKIVVTGLAGNGQATNKNLGNSDAFSVMNYFDRSVIGRLSNVTTTNDSIRVVGWTCQPKVNKALQARVYVGASPFDGGIKVGSRTTSYADSSANSKCETESTPHRFEIYIKKTDLLGHVGKPIYVDGVTTIAGWGNLVLDNSAALAVPNFTVQMNLSDIPKNGNNDTVILSGVDAFINADYHTRILKVQGVLRCPVNGNRKIEVASIEVDGGTIVCGNENNPVTGKIRFQFYGNLARTIQMDHDGMTMNHAVGVKSFTVHSGGRLKLYGQRRKSSWTTLRQTVNAGSNRIKLDREVNWDVGDLIAVAPSDFWTNESEEATITQKISTTEYVVQVNGSSDGKFRFRHHGVNHPYSSGNHSWTLKAKAEVANLSRQIVFETRDDMRSSSLEDSQRYIGAHTMVMRGAYAEVDAVEFKDMGQAGIMARYPFHWHLAGNVPGQLIRNSSIHHSFQRCITVHGTNDALVQNNVCFDHRGHGIFLEDGSEVRNTIHGNLVMNSKAPYNDRLLLESDGPFRNLREGKTTRERTTGFQYGRFKGPSSYWISNPNNAVNANVAAGSDGTGFWMSYEDRNLCNPDACSIPSQTQTSSFNNNVSRATAVGFSWDGARTETSPDNSLNSADRTIASVHYQPPSPPSFLYNQVMKSWQSGIYTRSWPMNFVSTVTASNVWHHFHAFNIRLIDSIMIAKTPNQSSTTWSSVADRISDKGHYGIVMYDGPFELLDVHFQNFSSQREYVSSTDNREITSSPIGTIGGFNKYTNRTSELTFAPSPLRRVDMNGDLERDEQWDDFHVSQSLLDTDGTLTGTAGSTVVYLHDMNAKANCWGQTQWNAWVCPPSSDYHLGTLRINDHDTRDSNPNRANVPNFYFITNRNGTTTSRTGKPVQGIWHNKVNMLLTGNADYTVNFQNQSGHNKLLTWYSEYNAQPSPVFLIQGISNTCSVSGAILRSSVQAVENSTVTSYYRTGRNLYVKIYPNAIDIKFTNGYIQSYMTEHYLNCN